jgi:hypothetical protein
VDAVQVVEQVLEPQAAVGHELVEVGQELAPPEGGEGFEVGRPGREPLAPEPRVLAGVRGELGQALLLEALEPLARPALTRQQLLACANAAREVLKPLDPVAHPVLLRPL